MTRTVVPRPHSTGTPGYSVTMPRTPESVGEARDLVRTALAAWGLDSLIDDAALLMSELLANAVLHARGKSVRVTVNRPTDDSVLLSVVDRAPGQVPYPRTASPEATGGRGLLLVDLAAHHWGYHFLGSGRAPWGKRVWALLCAEKPQ
ncbi:ATP-binding protein [Streptomyces acidiscabies]|uniref:ATP-binding protein n=1 Tax=Streptomyces acidiscabies TaxID=42234 RepID=UPI0030D39997